MIWTLNILVISLVSLVIAVLFCFVRSCFDLMIYFLSEKKNPKKNFKDCHAQTLMISSWTNEVSFHNFFFFICSFPQESWFSPQSWQCLTGPTHPELSPALWFMVKVGIGLSTFLLSTQQPNLNLTQPYQLHIAHLAQPKPNHLIKDSREQPKAPFGIIYV